MCVASCNRLQRFQRYPVCNGKRKPPKFSKQMNHERIYQLLLQKRNGTISEPDNEYVTGLINVHEDIELMWKAIKHSPSIQGEERFWHEMNTDTAWQLVEEKLQPRSGRVWWSGRWLIAALITG